MSNVRLTEWQRRKNYKEGISCFLMIGMLLTIYVCVFVGLNDYLWHSYVESSCFIINSTVIERARCSQYAYKPKSDAVWHLKVYPKQPNFIEYLADIREEFGRYYEAYEYISTHHLVGSHERCYVHSNDKYDLRWTESHTEKIVSALFGIGTCFFFIGVIVSIQFIWKEFFTI